jgi:hypothetical protein
MDCRDLCYFLQGFLEMNEEGLSQEQVKKVKAKLDVCLKNQEQPVKPYPSGSSGGSGRPPTYRC